MAMEMLRGDTVVRGGPLRASAQVQAECPALQGSMHKLCVKNTFLDVEDDNECLRRTKSWSGFSTVSSEEDEEASTLQEIIDQLTSERKALEETVDALKRKLDASEVAKDDLSSKLKEVEAENEDLRRAKRHLEAPWKEQSSKKIRHRWEEVANGIWKAKNLDETETTEMPCKHTECTNCALLQKQKEDSMQRATLLEAELNGLRCKVAQGGMMADWLPDSDELSAIPADDIVSTGAEQDEVMVSSRPSISSIASMSSDQAPSDGNASVHANSPEQLRDKEAPVEALQSVQSAHSLELEQVPQRRRRWSDDEENLAIQAAVHSVDIFQGQDVEMDTADKEKACLPSTGKGKGKEKGKERGKPKGKGKGKDGKSKLGNSKGDGKGKAEGKGAKGFKAKEAKTWRKKSFT